MKNSDKLIAAALVSAGLFSACQAMRYVKGLNESEKGAIIFAAESTNIVVADSAILGTGSGGSNGSGGGGGRPSSSNYNNA